MVLAKMCLVLASLSMTARAQPQDDVAIDIFAHAKGTVTASLGKLGAVEKRGSGPIDLVLIPGAPFGWRAWERFMKRNEQRYTMYAVTLAGYEGTAPPPMPATHEFSESEWTRAALDALFQVIEDHDLDRPIVIGHHLMGDYYAMKLALEHPDRVGGVIALAGQASRPAGNNVNVDLEARRKYVRDSLVPMYHDMTLAKWKNGTYQAASLSRDPAHGVELFERQVAVPVPTQLRYMFEYMTDDVGASLAQLRVPVLALQLPQRTLDELPSSMRDQVIARSGSREAATEALRTSDIWFLLQRSAPALIEVEQAQNTGIYIMDDQPEWFDAKVAAFAAKVAKG